MTETELRAKAETATHQFEQERQRIWREHNEKIEAIRFQERLMYALVIGVGVLPLFGPIIYQLLRK